MVDKYSLGFPLWYLQKRVCLLWIMICGSDWILSSWQILWHWFQVLSMKTILVNGNSVSTQPSVLSQFWNWSRPLLSLPGKTRTALSWNKRLEINTVYIFFCPPCCSLGCRGKCGCWHGPGPAAWRAPPWTCPQSPLGASQCQSVSKRLVYSLSCMTL